MRLHSGALEMSFLVLFLHIHSFQFLVSCIDSVGKAWLEWVLAQVLFLGIVFAHLYDEM